MSQIAWCVPVFVFGILTAYIDIDSFFREKRISYRAADTIEFWFVLLVNGSLSAGFLYWALSTGKDSPINKIIQAESMWGKTIVIGFGVPLLVRGKLFSFGENQTAAGPAFVYDWFRLKVFERIYWKSGEIKYQIIDQYGAQLAGRNGLDNDIKDWVDAYVGLLATPAQKAELDQEFARIQARYTGATALSKEHISKLLRWALDTTAINHIQNRLKKLAP